MAEVILAHGVSGCFGTKLAPMRGYKYPESSGETGEFRCHRVSTDRNGRRTQPVPLAVTEWKAQLCTGQTIFPQATATGHANAGCPRSR